MSTASTFTWDPLRRAHRTSNRGMSPNPVQASKIVTVSPGLSQRLRKRRIIRWLPKCRFSCCRLIKARANSVVDGSGRSINSKRSGSNFRVLCRRSNSTVSFSQCQKGKHPTSGPFFHSVRIKPFEICPGVFSAFIDATDTSRLQLGNDLSGKIDLVKRRPNTRTELDHQILWRRPKAGQHALERHAGD